MTAPLRGTARQQLALLAICLVLGMSPWFSATVTAPAMIADWHLAPSVAPWFTMVVQLGFVFGTLVGSLFMLSDRWRAQRFAGYSAIVAALATALLATGVHGARVALGLRALTGAALAGVYPPGLKLVAGWWKRRRGFAIGVLVGALTLGSASPHLVRLVVPADVWRPVVLVAAGAALTAGVLFLTAVHDGPYQAAQAPVSLAGLRGVVRDGGVVLAIGGYLGHMWELYAMWSWIAVFFAAVVARHGLEPAFASLMAFLTVAAGAVGCVIAGTFADRFGRTLVTIVSMIVSGACALVIGFLLDASPVLTSVVALVWGVAIVADSAQFSTCVTELAPPAYIGTALTLQTCLGFLLTAVSIRAVPQWAARWGWEHAFMPLAIGPACGIAAMWWLRRSPMAARLTGGHR